MDHRGSLPRLESAMRDMDWRRVKVVPLDLAQPWPTHARDELGYPDYIINYASQSHVDRSIIDPIPFVQNNVNLMLNMLQYAVALPDLQVFLQISTDEVYGPCAGAPHVEWSPIVPSNPYSASKAAQEALAISYWRTYNLPLVLTNTMNLIGEYQDDEKFVPMVIKSVLSNRIVTIHTGIDGKPGSRCWIHARNLADGVLWLLLHSGVSVYTPMQGIEPKPARWNIVGEELDNLTLAQRIATVLSRPLKYSLVDFHSTRPGHDARYALDGTALAEAGWTAPVSLDTAIKAITRWPEYSD